MKQGIYISGVILLFCVFNACSGEAGKKVVVMASGKIGISGNTITLQPGTTHTETSLVPEADSIIVVSPTGNTGFSVKEAGLYVLNLKKDTLVGSYQRTGTDNSQQSITQESLWERIDSLTKLIQGQNVSEAARNYHIPPFRMSRITNNTEAQIIGPFHKIPGSFDPSKKHEVYKFYTNRDVMEIIERVKKMLAG